ncbi:MAG: hypothetical protein ACLGHN_13660 [Bacteriovoracia bacterium]
MMIFRLAFLVLIIGLQSCSSYDEPDFAPDEFREEERERDIINPGYDYEFEEEDLYSGDEEEDVL